MNFLRIGLTGGPGCGKSEAGRIFSTFPGWHCLDADQVCHEIYSEPDSPFVRLLEARWGKSVRAADGMPDRKVIAEKIFDDENERNWLNSVLHPEIFTRLERQAAEAQVPYVVIEAPLLFESEWHSGMDRTIAVWSPPEIQMERLLGRGWTREHAEKRIAAQLPAMKKLELADYGIINRSTLESLREQCRRTADRIEQERQLQH